MSEIDYGKLCIQFKQKLSRPFIERIERRLSLDFEEALKEKPKDLLLSILQDIHLYYVSPQEMTFEVAAYLEAIYDISRFSLALSEDHDIYPAEKTEEAIQFVNAFYTMVESLGLAESFEKRREIWWKNEF
jgi:hypothetical protein